LSYYDYPANNVRILNQHQSGNIYTMQTVTMIALTSLFEYGINSACFR